MDVTLDSPLAGGGASRIRVRDLAGAGVPVVHLHGGWGYDIYPVDAAALPGARLVIPDRTGYGASTAIDALPPRFHEAAAIETERLLDALGIDRCVVWGHSDGAVIAALLGLRDPARYRGLVLEAIHVDRAKPGSRQFFTDMAEDPTRFGPRVAAVLHGDHGDRWQDVLRMGGRAWLAIAARPDDDFYGGRLAALAPPVLIVHGADDPRTEPGELDALRRALPAAELAILPDGGHCPHAHPRTAAEVTARIGAFVAALP
ncbi:MAG: alpha/beta fold hydrolase [Kofleriaceae bacterium]|nr:alpha/beta fold hydrolase [Myxococcales bacterium]MCB9564145.1 alpha/beta fold hydrolase [Kofleriaceae bacterium]MCB9572488.1 alpha/beta fold hydrolase [Kofleriaceae bacterium]